MSIFYGITLAVSLLLLLVYFYIDRKRNIWLQLLFIFVTICNTGYFLMSVSISLKMALAANTIAYFGNVFLPFFILMMVIQLSCVKCPRMLPGSLIALNTIMFLIVASAGHLPIYYRSVSFEIIDGVARLTKVYGILQNFKNAPSEANEETSLISDSTIIPLSKTDHSFSEKQIKILLENWGLSYGLSQREKEVFKFILEKHKRKDIAQVLFVTESTIKKHTSNIYKKHLTGINCQCNSFLSGVF